jgi:beta-mannosidase
MNWMFSEIWPSATWAVVDYYGEPKQAFYQMKNSFAPILLTFVEKKNGKTALTLVNDTLQAFTTKVTYGVKTLQGDRVWKKTKKIFVAANGATQVEIDEEVGQANTYLYANCKVNGQPLSTVYSCDMWHTCNFESNYTYKVKKTEKGLAVAIKAKSFAKGVTLRLPENCNYTYSDNYFDMQAGEKKTVYVYGEANTKDLVVTDFAKEIKNA